MASPTVIGAWIAAGASAYAAILGRNTQEKVKSLEMANTIRELILRSVSPILFEFGDSCEIARERILLLLKLKANHRLGKLRPRKGLDTGRLLTGTIYRLLEPIAFYRLLLRHLSPEILHLDRNIDLQYRLAKLLYATFTTEVANELEKRDPPITYSPGITPLLGAVNDTTLNIMIGGLMATTDNKVMGYEKFLSIFGQVWEDNRANYPSVVDAKSAYRKWFVYLFRNRLDQRPVLWRILLTQLYIYEILRRIRNDSSLTFRRFKSSDEASKWVENAWKEGLETWQQLYNYHGSQDDVAVKDYLKSKFKEIYYAQKSPKRTLLQRMIGSH